MLLRATRLWAMSPTRPTVSPATRPEPLADGEDVEQALRRVLVGAVAGVDDANVRQQVLRQQVRRAGRRVPHDHHVDAHRLDVLGGVDERLALGGAGAAGGEVERVGAEPPRGQAEADRACGVDGSKKRLTTTLPLRSSRLGTSPTPTPRKRCAESSRRVSSAAERPSSPSRCFMSRSKFQFQVPS